MLLNTKIGYGWAAIVLHWAIALLIIGQWVLGWTMEHIADQRRAFDLIQWHKSFGFLILALAVLRLGWRLLNPVPQLPAGMRSPERLAAKASHRMLYALMLLLPLSGWALVSVSVLEIPTFAFYLFIIPHLPLPKSDAAEALWTSVHLVFAWSLLVLVALHVLAALRHQFLLRDGIMERIVRPPSSLTRD